MTVMHVMYTYWLGRVVEAVSSVARMLRSASSSLQSKNHARMAGRRPRRTCGESRLARHAHAIECMCRYAGQTVALKELFSTLLDSLLRLLSTLHPFTLSLHLSPILFSFPRIPSLSGWPVAKSNALVMPACVILLSLQATTSTSSPTNAPG